MYFSLSANTLTFLLEPLTNRNMTDIETCYKAFRAGVIKPLRLPAGLRMEVRYGHGDEEPGSDPEVPISPKPEL